MRPLSRSLFLAAVALGAMTVHAPVAAACTCVPRSPGADLRGAEAVFEAFPTVVDRADDAVTATVAVLVVYKGDVPASATVTGPPNDGHACAVGFVPGERYVFYAQARGSTYEVDSCGTYRDPARFEAVRRDEPIARYTPPDAGAPLAVASVPAAPGIRTDRSGLIAAAGLLMMVAGGGLLVRMRLRGRV